MRVVRARHSLAIAAALVLGTMVPLLSAPTALASTPKAQPYPEASPIEGLSTAAQMVDADGKLFVSAGPSGSQIEVLSGAGKRIGQIAGEPGADGMVASADGKTLYVALNKASAISVIDTATMAETARYTVDACPAIVALAAGRLFYSYGCDTTGGVSSIDPDSGGTPVSALTGSYVGQIVRGNGSELAVTAADDSVSTYTAASDGSVTEQGTVTLETWPRDVTFTSNGADVLTVSGAPYQITAYNAATMAQDTVYPGTSYPEAVAADPNGKYVAGGFDSYDATAMLFGESSTSVLWQRYTTGTNPSTWAPNVSDDHMIPQTMTFSADGTHVYGLVVRENLSGIYFFASTIAPTKSSISMEIPTVHGYGKKRTVVALVPGTSGLPVTFTLTEAGVHLSAGTVNTKSGVARRTFKPVYNGTMTASVLGTASTYPSSTSAKYVVDSKTVVSFRGKHTMRHGIAIFKKFKQIRVLFRTLPPVVGRQTTNKLEAWHKGRWYVVGGGSAPEGGGGLLIHLENKPPKRLLLRIHLVAKTDSFSRGSSATSKSFELG